MKLTRHNKAYAVPLLKNMLFGDELYPIKSLIMYVDDLKYELKNAKQSTNIIQKLIYSVLYILITIMLYFPELISYNIRKIYILNYIKRKGINNYLRKIVISKEK